MRYVNKENNLRDNIILNQDKKLITSINFILEEAKTEQIITMNVSKNSTYTDTLIIATCRSTRHADATADQLVQKLKKIGFKCPNPEGRPQCDWVIVDVGTVIVHLFKQEIRKHYNLEKLWGMSFELIKNKLA